MGSSWRANWALARSAGGLLQFTDRTPLQATGGPDTMRKRRSQQKRVMDKTTIIFTGAGLLIIGVYLLVRDTLSRRRLARLYSGVPVVPILVGYLAGKVREKGGVVPLIERPVMIWSDPLHPRKVPVLALGVSNGVFGIPYQYLVFDVGAASSAMEFDSFVQREQWWSRLGATATPIAMAHDLTPANELQRVATYNLITALDNLDDRQWNYLPPAQKAGMRIQAKDQWLAVCHNSTPSS